MNYIIRKIKDTEELKELNIVFSDVFESPELKNTNDSLMDEILQREDIQAIGAFWEEELIGGLSAYELPLMSGKKEMYIYDIAVKKDYRKNGIATALINELGKLALSRGIETIFVEAEADDETAVSFYKSLGVEELSVKHFNIKIIK